MEDQPRTEIEHSMEMVARIFGKMSHLYMAGRIQHVRQGVFKRQIMRARKMEHHTAIWQHLLALVGQVSLLITQ